MQCSREVEIKMKGILFEMKWKTGWRRLARFSFACVFFFVGENLSSGQYSLNSELYDREEATFVRLIYDGRTMGANNSAVAYIYTSQKVYTDSPI